MEGPKILKIKGFYLGMDIDKACEVLRNSLHAKKCEYLVDLYEGGYELIHFPRYRTPEIKAGPDKKVNYMFFSGSDVEELFDAYGYDPVKFVDKFTDAYKIPKMKPFFEKTAPLKKKKLIGWRYISPFGYKVTIYANSVSPKSLKIETIPSTVK
jgi:hypothetical protein